MILVDSNVFIASLFEEHVHHAPSSAFFNAGTGKPLLTAAHCLSEIYSQMTRASGPFRVAPRSVAEQLGALALGTRVVALSASQTADAIRRFAMIGGIGPRLYDYLIGATGEAFGANTIVTWNVRHFDGLFPHLRIVTPEAFAA